MSSEIRLGFKLDLSITTLDIREPIFAYYHELQRSRENQEARQHGHALVTKTFRDGGRYWVTLSFPDLPDIFCLDERHNKLRGIPLEEAVSSERKAKLCSGFMEARELYHRHGKAYEC
jgi:hypothetical protein